MPNCFLRRFAAMGLPMRPRPMKPTRSMPLPPVTRLPAGSMEASSPPIAGVVLTGGDVDAIAGLLTLRERHAFAVYATRAVHRVLRANPIFNVLAPDCVERVEVAADETIELARTG